MRYCNTCHKEKDESEFDKRSGRKVNHCKDCRREKIRQHYRDNKQYYVDKAAKRRKEIPDFYTEYKKTLKCEDCGLDFKDQPYLCDFHHIDGKKDKEFVPSRMKGNKTKFLKEIKKCVALCANCHRKRHHAPLAKLDKAPEYESGDSEGSNPSRST